jgi:hypothetical protein
MAYRDTDMCGASKTISGSRGCRRREGTAGWTDVTYVASAKLEINATVSHRRLEGVERLLGEPDDHGLLWFGWVNVAGPGVALEGEGDACGNRHDESGELGVINAICARLWAVKRTGQ